MTTDVDVAADAALVYLEEIAVAGFGLFFFQHAVDAAMDFQVEIPVADADVITTLLLVTTHVSGLLFFFSSVAAATITVAANSQHCQWVLYEPIGFSQSYNPSSIHKIF